MEVLREIEFTEALLRLQELLGSQVKATVNYYGQFFGCGLSGELCRVQTLPPDHSAISVEFDSGQGFFLDPTDARTFLGRGHGDTDLLEFQMAYGVSVVVELADEKGEW
jgi:hypothetical protein